MDVTTKNQNNRSHQHQHQHRHHLSVPHQNMSTNSNGNSSDVPNSGNGADGARSPFQREVREWQRIDPDTGALLTGRLEADCWTNGPLNSYGKISDSQNISQPDGTQHTQRKQFEVLQARTSHGAMQVIRTQTVQKTSSRWSSSTSASSTSSPVIVNNYSYYGSIDQQNNNTFPHNHVHKPMHLSETNTHRPQITNTYDVDEDNDVSVDDVHNDDIDAHANIEDIVDNDDTESCSEDQHYIIKKCSSGSNSNSKSHTSHLLNGHSLNYHSNSQNSYNNNLLLLDTAPSLKLSNLMKSSSSISSNTSSSNNSTITTSAATSLGTTNTYKKPSKISLHAIVGNNNDTSTDPNANNTKKSATSSSTATALTTPTTSITATARTTSWQQKQAQTQSQQQQERNSRLLEQPAIYGNSSDSSTKSQTTRVGVDDYDEYIVVAPRVTNLSDICAGAGVGTGTGAGNGSRNTNVGNMNSNSSYTNRLIGGSTFQQNVRLTPTQLNRQQQRQDLESFRHYNVHETATSPHSKINNNDVIDDDAEDLRNLTLYQRRQLHPNRQHTSTTLQRSRSISTDDLSTDWENNDKLAEEPSEWRRVSKLRRSFQSTSSSTASTPRRPIDLPTSTVNVSKIRADLENGRRLNTAMRNNHVDLAALESILNGPAQQKPTPAKRTTFLTAENLKEIRGKLKKLSDESLYKDDYVIHQQPVQKGDQIDVQHRLLPERHLRQLTPEQSTEVLPTKSAFQIVTKDQLHRSSTIDSEFEQLSSISPAVSRHTTNSLESRQKLKDTSTAEWHMRRKSYGFEKMSPPADRSIFRMDASTDSGLGRSGELGNWSPTETTPPVRATVVHFSELANSKNQANVQKRYRQIRSPKEVEEEQHKRHSIAVDESEYMRDNIRKTSQVHLNGFAYDIANDGGAKSLQTIRTDAIDTLQNSSSSSLFQRSQQKRVEFCKTEVHFAAESGRVNIVETDGKPPPTNNFRRRRRTTSGALATNVPAVGAITTTNASANESSNSVALPITHFGDDQRRKTIATTTVAYKATLEDPITDAVEPINVTVSTPKRLETYNISESSRNSYASTSGVDTTDGENDEISTIRGILKNKPVKPKPYIFSHMDDTNDTADTLFGVHLKPVTGIALSAVTTRLDNISNDSLKSSATGIKTVAERVRIAEKRQDATNATQSNNYSTKINLSLGDTPADWNETELPKSNVMNIELHSPHESLELKTNDALKTKQATSMTKPRSMLSDRQPISSHAVQSTKVNIPMSQVQKKTEPIKEPLKIIKETRGARKLREHELSYFGIQVDKNDAKNVTATKVHTSNPALESTSKRNLPQRKPAEYKSNSHSQTETKPVKQTTKWHLLNDKPDLLRHSPIVVEPQVITRTAEIRTTDRDTKHTQPVPMQNVSFEKFLESELEEFDEDDEHFYENITNELKPVFKVKPPSVTNSYDRKADLQRDAMILSEMTKNADQTLKALSDEAALKDQRRRSLHRRNPKPLETIDEKSITEKINDNCIAVKVTRNTVASEAKRTSRHSTPSPTMLVNTARVRTSSQSSTESCTRARSNSLSSEREYENIRKSKHESSKPKKQTKYATNSRSSSRDSTQSSHTQCSSADELTHARDYARSKTKRHTSVSQTKDKRSKEHAERKRDDQQQHRRTHADRQRPSGTVHSSRRERIECPTDGKSHLDQHQQQQQQKQQPTCSYSERKRRDLQNVRAIVVAHAMNEFKNKREHTGQSSSRGTQTHTPHSGHALHVNEVHEPTAHRAKSERTDKEKSTRSRGHSSRLNSNERLSHPIISTKREHERKHERDQEREHKKSYSKQATTTTTNGSHDTKYAESNAKHSKNVPTTKGQEHVHHHTHHQHEPQPTQSRSRAQQQPHHQRHHSQQPSATKQRERSAKEKK